MSGIDPRVNIAIESITKATNNTVAITSNGVTMKDMYTNPGDWRYFGFALGVIVVVLGTAGNGLTVWAYNNNRNLRTSFNVLIANLCCVELLFSLVIIPLQLPGYIMEKSPYPEAVCSIIGYLYYSLIGASLQNLVSIAINRYVGIVNTKRYQRLFTGNRLRLWVASIWITPLLLHLPLAIGGVIKWRDNTLRCSIGREGVNQAIRIYNTILNIIYQAGGLTILIGLYAAIIKKVRKVQKKLKVHKKASFRMTNKSKLTVKPKIEIHSTPATTSGDEGIDDYRPSSIISGGFQFRPANDGKPHEILSDSGHGSDHEVSHCLMSKRISGHTNSQASFMTGSDEPSPKPQKRRQSLFQVLFRTKAKTELTVKDEPRSPDYTTDDHSVNHGTTKHSNDVQEPSNETPSPDHNAIPVPAPVVLRGMDENKRDIRRKKSLSAPTLPSLEDIIQSSRKNSAAVAQNIPEQLTEVNEVISPETSPSRLARGYTVGSQYKRNKTHHAANGSLRMTAKQINFLSPNSITNQLCSTDKTICTSMPTLAQTVTSETPPSHTRHGTIARRIKGHRSKSRKKPKSEKQKQREKAARRRHARERQLVYSSLTICVAFALCMMPASLLYIAQTLFKFQVHAAVLLVLGCISWLHAFVNPFIYGYMNHLYRKEYGQIAKDMEKKLAACFK